MGKCILVVDGEQIGWHILQQALATAGYEVLCVGDGEQALQSVTESIPDLVLLEIQLKGKAAILETTKQLLQQRRFDEAEQMLHGALAKDPADPQVFNLLGVALELKGMLQEAAQFYRVALCFRPGLTRAQQNLRRVTTWPYLSKGLSAELLPEVENGNE